MARTVLGLFDDFEDGRAAAQDLLRDGFRPEEVSLAANDQPGMFAAAIQEEDTGLDQPADLRAGEVGSLFGNLPDVMSGFGITRVTGAGPSLVAGPLLAALSGAGIRAEGDLFGILEEAGVPASDARIYVEGLRRGGTLIMVNTMEDRADQAVALLNEHHPVDLQKRSADWAKERWQGFDNTAEAFAFKPTGEPKPFREREPMSELDYGPGARTFLAGQPVADYRRGEANMDNYIQRQPDNWKVYEPRFREHFENTYASGGKRWEDYRDAYRFGYEQALEERFFNENWPSVQPYLQQMWETRFIGNPWIDFQDAVAKGWEVGHMPG